MNTEILETELKSNGIPAETQMKMVYETITPERAREMLAQNKKNRKEKKRATAKYAHQIANGLWRENHQPIAIDKHGIVQDGQHRLQSCIESDTAFNTWVCYDCDPEAFHTIDIGSKRSISDILGIDGFESAAKIASTVSMYNKFVYNKWSGKVNVHAIRATESEILEAVRQNHTFYEKGMRLAGKWRKKFPLLPQQAYGGFFLYLTANQLEEKAQDFLNKFTSGIGIEESSAIYMVRERLISDANTRKGSKKLALPAKIGLMVKAWNFFASGKKPKSSIRYTLSDNPKIYLGKKP